jgi:hypothetical protein
MSWILLFHQNDIRNLRKSLDHDPTEKKISMNLNKIKHNMESSREEKYNLQ